MILKILSLRTSLRRLAVIIVMLLVVAILCLLATSLHVHTYTRQFFITEAMPRLSQNASRFAALPLSGDITGYDVEEVSRWSRGSECSGRGGQFVGPQPLFGPCVPDLAPTVATWGRYPYLGPRQYVNGSRNPCWAERGHLKCVPYFFLIGVSKSGTSDLYHRLTSHPQIALTVKEPHFFDRRRYAKSERLSNYVYHYRNVAARIERDILTRGHSNIICGDASPSYFYDNYHWSKYSGNEGCSEPRVILANHIAYLHPGVKLILIIRHPVHRLYSRYLFDYGRHHTMYKKPAPSAASFHSLVSESLHRFRDCFQRWSLRHCLYNHSLMLSFHDLRIQENLYPVLLEDWLRVVPRDQFIFLRFEDYRQDMASHLRRVFDFLGVDELSEARLHSITSRSVHNQGRYVNTTGPMLEKTRLLLQDFYAPFIRRFAAMLGDRRFLWEDVDQSGKKI